MSTNLPLLELWYTAFRSELGVVIETNDPERLRQKLYAVRKATDDPDLACLHLVISPLNPGDLWIIKQPKEIHNGEE